MTAMTSEAAMAASTSAFNGGNGTAMVASAAETTLKVRAEVSARARADSSSCGKGGGASGSEGKGKGAADSDGCGESCGDGCGKGSVTAIIGFFVDLDLHEKLLRRIGPRWCKNHVELDLCFCFRSFFPFRMNLLSVQKH
jgi:hypothetical protein